MAIKNFIKENFVLCVGISLPILLVVMFLLSNTLPRFFAAPPQYKLVLADYQVHYNGPRAGYSVAFQVDKDGKLQMRLTPVTDGYSSHTPHLLIYDGQRDSFRKVDISLPDAGAYTGAVTLPVKEVENYKLDTNNKAPDGYAFLQGRGGSRILLAMGTLGMLGYIGDFAFDHFKDQASFPILLMILGIAFFGLGAMAVRINKKFISGKDRRAV